MISSKRNRQIQEVLPIGLKADLELLHLPNGQVILLRWHTTLNSELNLNVKKWLELLDLQYKVKNDLNRKRN